jgi:hypothetical protein
MIRAANDRGQPLTLRLNEQMGSTKKILETGVLFFVAK